MSRPRNRRGSSGKPPPQNRPPRFWGSVLWFLVVLAVILGYQVIKTDSHQRDCAKLNGTLDAVGGEFDDWFEVCRDSGHRVIKVYSQPATNADPILRDRCDSIEGTLYEETMSIRYQRRIYMCLSQGDMAWWEVRY